RLHAVTNDTASAVLALGRQRMNGAFEAVVGAGGAVEPDLHRVRVLASTDSAACHGALLLLSGVTRSRGLLVTSRLQQACPRGGAGDRARAPPGHAVACRLPPLYAGARGRSCAEFSDPGRSWQH